MEALLIIFSIFVTVLTIIMVVKFFQVASNVKAIKEKSTDTLHDVRVWYIKGDMQKAHDALNEAFINDLAELSFLLDSSEYGVQFKAKQAKIEFYKKKFDKIGLGHPDYAKYNNLDKFWL